MRANFPFRRFAHSPNTGRAAVGLRGFTILELLTSIGVIGGLAAMLLPAIGSAREAARRTQCTQQLRQIGIALHSYHESHLALPSGVSWDSTSQSVYGWGARLLPYLEHRTLHEQIHFDLPLTHPGNLIARQTALAAFVCPSDISAETFTLYEESELEGLTGVALTELPTANYMGVFGTSEPDEGVPIPTGEGAFIDSRPVSFAQLLQGLGNTVIVGERTTARIPSTWLGVDMRGEDAACRLLGNNATVPNCQSCDECEFASRHPGGSGFLWADGHVDLISNEIDPQEYRRMSLRSTN